MTDKITKFPRRYSNARRLDATKGKLRCEVSERWIQFPSHSWKTLDTEYITLDIMTLGSNEKERKICEIIVDKQTLLKILSELPVKTV